MERPENFHEFPPQVFQTNKLIPNVEENQPYGRQLHYFAGNFIILFFC